MEWLQSAAGINLLYLFLVAGIWMSSIALIVPGTGLYEALAGLFLFLAGAGLLAVPVNTWAAGLILAGAFSFILALLWRRQVISLLAAGALFSAGSVFLFRVEGRMTAVDPLLAILASGSTVGFFWFSLRKALDSQQALPVLDVDRLVDTIGEARTDIDPVGSVYISGELWTARAENRIAVSEKVVVTGRSGLILEVKKVK